MVSKMKRMVLLCFVNVFVCWTLRFPMYKTWCCCLFIPDLSTAHRWLRPEKYSTRSVRKVGTGKTGLWQPSVHSDLVFWSFNVGSSHHWNAEVPKCRILAFYLVDFCWHYFWHCVWPFLCQPWVVLTLSSTFSDMLFCGPAVPTEIENWRWRSGNAHWKSGAGLAGRGAGGEGEEGEGEQTW